MPHAGLGGRVDERVVLLPAVLGFSSRDHEEGLDALPGRPLPGLRLHRLKTSGTAPASSGARAGQRTNSRCGLPATANSRATSPPR